MPPLALSWATARRMPFMKSGPPCATGPSNPANCTGELSLPLPLPLAVLLLPLLVLELFELPHADTTRAMSTTLTTAAEDLLMNRRISTLLHLFYRTVLVGAPLGRGDLPPRADSRLHVLPRLSVTTPKRAHETTVTSSPRYAERTRLSARRLSEEPSVSTRPRSST